MVKNKYSLEVKIGERVYDLCLPNDAPLGELFDAISQMQAFVIQKIQESVPKKAEPPKEEPPKAE